MSEQLQIFNKKPIFGRVYHLFNHCIKCGSWWNDKLILKCPTCGQKARTKAKHGSRWK